MAKVNVSLTQFSLSIAISVAFTPNLRKLNFSQISPCMSESFEYVGPDRYNPLHIVLLANFLQLYKCLWEQEKYKDI